MKVTAASSSASGCFLANETETSSGVYDVKVCGGVCVFEVLMRLV